MLSHRFRQRTALFVALLATGLTPLMAGAANPSGQYSAPPPPPGQATAQSPNQSNDWMPSGIEQLGKTAEVHNDFTLDRNTLQVAGALAGGDADTRKAIAKLNAVSVHLYRYAQPGMYDPRQLDAIRQQYHEAGWKHLVSKSGHPAANAPMPPNNRLVAPSQPNGAPNMPDTQGHVDLYLKFQGTDIVAMVVIQASPRNLNVVSLSGDISPLDLLHLRGHFGIPKFSGDDFTPADN
jgi:hypothetical protein